MGLDTYEPRHRLGAYLRRQYRGEHKTKRLAAEVNCTPKAAENMLADHWPNSRHWASIVQRFGRDVIDAVFLPEIDAKAAALREEVRALEEQLEEKRRLARAMGASDARVATHDRRVQDRAAELTGEPAP